MGAFHIGHFLLLSLLSDAKLSLEENMKRSTIIMYSGLFCVVLAVLMTASGCMSGAGETRAEVEERHNVIVQTQKKQIQNDWDSVLLLNKSSKLSDKYVR